MTEIGLTDEDLRKIREAVESDAYSMAETLTDNSKRNPNFATHEVGVRECALIRCMRGCGKSNREIIDATGFCEKTVRLHATGRCSHSEPVPAPPTVLREGPHTEGIDHEKTRERRREWREEKTVAPGAARQVMTDGGTQSTLPPQSGSHYAEDTDDSDETVYERAGTVVRRCRGDVNKYCAWMMSYEGDELDAILKDNGCIDADKVDRRCPLCGGPVEEDYYGLDDRQGVPK